MISCVASRLSPATLTAIIMIVHQLRYLTYFPSFFVYTFSGFSGSSSENCFVLSDDEELLEAPDPGCCSSDS